MKQFYYIKHWISDQFHQSSTPIAYLMIPCLLLSLFILGGCEKDSPEKEKPEEFAEWPAGQNIFAAGFEERTKGNTVAKYWENGKIKNLSNTTKATSATEEEIFSKALSIHVDGDDVYIAGYAMIQANGNDERTSVARLWKNGVIQPLESGKNFEQAVSVFVSEGDVYVLGSESSLPNPSSSSNKFIYKYWKNGKAEVFEEAGTGLEGVNSIFVSDGNVYVAGGYGKQAKLWKNGIGENLPEGEYASSVFVSGNDVYIAGYGDSKAKLWKNGRAENLTNGQSSAKAYSVFVADNNIYVAGSEGDNARLWKNGTAQNFTNDKNARVFFSVFASGDDIYTSGYEEIIEPIKGSSTSIGRLNATLWRNGKKLKLDTNDTYNSQALSVFVK